MRQAYSATNIIHASTEKASYSFAGTRLRVKFTGSGSDQIVSLALLAVGIEQGSIGPSAFTGEQVLPPLQISYGSDHDCTSIVYILNICCDR